MSDIGNVGCCEWGFSECGILGIWDIWNVGYLRCDLLGMWNVENAGCWGCEILWMWDVSDVNCWERTLFRIQGVVDAEWLGFGTLGM